MMAFDAYKILDEREAGSMIDLIAPCMDDYLYIIDLKNDTLRISQSAVERFMLPDKFMNKETITGDELVVLKNGIILYKGADKFSFTGSGRLSWIKYPAQSSTWNTSSTSILKYFDIRSINSADGVLSPRSILPTVWVLYPIAAARSSW